MKRHLWKPLACLLLAVVMLAGVPMTAQAKNYSENGTWKKKIKGTTWYFDVNDYTSREPGAKYYGTVYIYKGKSNFNKRNYCVYGQYYKVSKNKYRIDYDGGRITFKVAKKKLTLTQNKGKVKGTKLKGTFKLVRRHYA